MGLLDYIDPDQFHGDDLLGGLFVPQPQPNSSQSGAGIDLQYPLFGNSQPSVSADASNSLATPPSPDIGARLSAGLQGWAQTPVGSPFAALANGITGFNNAANASFIGPRAPTSVQTPDLGNQLGAAFQNWAQTPVGNPIAALANGIAGFNTGQQTAAAPAQAPATPAQDQTPDPGARANAAVQGTANVSAGNAALVAPVRRLAVIRRWPQ